MTDYKMRIFVSIAKKLVDKAKEYNKYNNRLEKTAKNIGSVSTVLSNSLSIFKNGGYVEHGKALYDSEINLLITRSEDISDNIDKLIEYNNKKIEEFRVDYNFYKSKFEREKNLFLVSEDRKGSVPTFPEFILE